MFLVLKCLSLVFLIASVVLDIARANGRGEKKSLSCYRVEHGIIWCSQSTKERIYHFASFLEEIDEETSYKALIDFLTDKKTANFSQKFLLTCITTCSNEETTRCSCYDYTYQLLDETQPETFLSKSGSNEDSALFLGVDLPKELNFLYIDSEENTDVSTNQLQVRAVRTRSSGRCPLHGKTNDEIHQTIMKIAQDRYKQGHYNIGRNSNPEGSERAYYKRGGMPKKRNIQRGYSSNEIKPKRKNPPRRFNSNEIRPGIRNTDTRVQNIVQEIRSGNVQIYQTSNLKMTNYRNGKVVQKKRKHVPLHDIHGNDLLPVPFQGVPQVLPFRPVAAPRLKRKKKQAVQKQGPKNDPPPISRSPQSASVNRHLLPENNKVIKLDPDDPKLLDESTPNVVKPEYWSEPVDGDDLRQRLQGLQARQKQGYSLRP